MNQPCPICGKPIEDTAYVCARCTAYLAADLHRLAQGWHELETTIARQTASTGVAGAPRRDTTLRGPHCRGMTCDHESCEAIWKSRHRALTEALLAHEDPSPVAFAAAEDGWIIRHTLRSWAKHVTEQRGVTIRPERPKILQPTVVTDPEPEVRPERCHYSDLPVDQCGCGRHRERMTS